MRPWRFSHCGDCELLQTARFHSVRQGESSLMTPGTLLWKDLIAGLYGWMPCKTNSCYHCSIGTWQVRSLVSGAKYRGDLVEMKSRAEGSQCRSVSRETLIVAVAQWTCRIPLP